MLRISSFTALVVAALVLAGASTAATPKLGGSCAPPGSTARTGTAKLVCAGPKGKSVWARAKTAPATEGGRCARLGSWVRTGTAKLVCVSRNGKSVWARAKTAPATEGGAPTSGSLWRSDESGAWQALGPAPACASGLFSSPADLSTASAILYPGQTRGTYKAHGGIRFDGVVSGEVTVRAPTDAYLVQGTRYLEGGQIQYGFDFIVPCGYAYRLDHLLVLEPAFQQVAEALPPARENDSRTTFINPPRFVKAGTVIATTVGFPGNSFFDFGVYDIRQANRISKDAAWAAQHPQRQWDWYGVCWLDMLPAADSARARSLPGGDHAAGTQSDYCS